MKNDVYIQTAVKKECTRSGSVESFAKKLGFAYSAVNAWKNGENKTIRDNNFIILYPFIKRHLPENHPAHEIFGDKQRAQQTQPENNASFLTTPQSRMIPVISMASAAGYEPTFDPFDEFVENNAISETVYIGDLKEGCIAIQIEGDSMSPKFPHGTIVIVDTKNLPKRGDYVVARMQDNGIVFKQYFRKNNVIELRSINPEGKNYKWHIKEKPGFCLFMWPALEAKIDLSKQRWEEKKI